LDLAAALRPPPAPFDFDKYRRDMLAWHEELTAEMGSREAAEEFIDARFAEGYERLMSQYEGKRKVSINGRCVWVPVESLGELGTESEL
jgi:hypothetical protein